MEFTIWRVALLEFCCTQSMIYDASELFYRDSSITDLIYSLLVLTQVAPRHRNYFFDELVPWQHYIPVKNDMTDLVIATQYAVADETQDAVRAIIRRANEWCRTHLTKQHMATDMYWMINSYISSLDIVNNVTRRSQWEALYSKLLQGQ